MPTPTHPPAERFTALIEELCRVLTKHASARFIDPALLLLIWNRLMRIAQRFANLAERVRTGTRANPAPAQPRHAASPPTGAPRQRPDALPHHFRWLVNMLPEAEAIAADLCWQLQRVEMEELIFRAPEVGRILRPLCRMLGVDPIASLRLPARAPVATATEAPVAPPADDAPWLQSPTPTPPSEPEADAWETDQRKRA